MEQEMPLPKRIYLGFSLRQIGIALLLLVICTCLGFLGGEYLTTHSQKKASTSTVVLTPSPTDTPPPSNMIGGYVDKSDFEKRQIDTTQLFYNKIPYPQEITNVPDSNLVDMQCTYNITRFSSNEPYIFDDYMAPKIGPSPTPQVTPTQQLADSLHYEVLQNTGFNPWAFKTCTTMVKGNPNKYDFFTFLSVNDESYIFHNKNILVSMHTGFGTCNYPIQLTTDGTLYFICSTGENSRTDAIYKININIPPNQKVTQCVTPLGSSESSCTQ